MLYRIAYALFWLILRPALALCGGFRVEGELGLPSDGGLLLAPNHASYSDPPIIGLSSTRPVWFMTKAHLFRIPVVGDIMRVFNAFPVEPEGVDRKAIRFSENLLTDGQVLCIFPEGSVSEDGRLQPLKQGVALLALRTGVPVVPVALVRTHRFLSPTRYFPGYATGGVVVRFGTAFSVSDAPDGLSRQQTMDWVTERLAREIRDLLPVEQQPAAEE